MNRQPHRYLTALVLLSVSCGSPDKDAVHGDQPIAKPSMLLVEKVISGVVLGNPLKQPYGLAVGQGGRLYVTDAGNDRLVQFSGDFTPVRDYGGYGGEAGLLDRPGFLTIDNDLNLMVSDEGNRRVSRYDSRLNFVNELLFKDEQDPLKFGYPSGIAFTDYGEVWVADRDKDQIAVFSNVGNFDRLVGDYGYAGGSLSSPEKICRERSGNFIVCDAGNRRLMVYDAYGNFNRQIAVDRWEYPSAALVHADLVWVLDKATAELFCLDRRGEVVLRTGPGLPGNDIALKRPSDLAIMPSGELIIADTGNNRLLVCRIIYQNE